MSRPSRDAAPSATEASTNGPTSAPTPAPAGGGLAAAYQLLRKAIADLLEDQEADAVRDSDVKRRMLALESDFNEDKLGFPKFSRFLRQAHDHEIVDLRKGEGGNYQVALGSREAPPGEREESASGGTPGARVGTGTEAERPAGPSTSTPRTSTAPPASSTSGKTADAERPSRPLRPRDAGPMRGRRGGGDHPPLFEGQVVRPSGERSGSSREAPNRAPEVPPPPSTAPTSSPPTSTSPTSSPPTSTPKSVDPGALRLPTGRDSIVQYLSNSYSGVGQKTAETLVDALGDELFAVLQENPDRIRDLLPAGRAEKLLDAWRADFERRSERATGDDAAGTRSDGNGSSGDLGMIGEGGNEAGEKAEKSGPPVRRARRTRGGSR